MIKVYGDGFDALITINLLLKSGCKVTHFSSTEKFGGHFSGLNSCGGRFDIGMVLFEPDFVPGISKNLEDYNGEFGRTSRVYLEEVFFWFESQFSRLNRHQVLVQSSSGDEMLDYFISDNLQFLEKLDENQTTELKKRLTSLLKNPTYSETLHPKHKSTNKSAATVALSDLLREIYGKEIYKNFFEGFLQKVSDQIDPKISSRDNRRVWMPNYYPESLLYALTKDHKLSEFELKPLSFLRPKDMQIADLLWNLNDENLQNENYKKIKVDGKDCRFNLHDQNSIYFINLREITNFEELDSDFMRKFNKSSKINSPVFSNFFDVTHFCVETCESKTVFVPDKSNQVIRYSYYPSERSSISVESISGNIAPKILSLEILKDHGIKPICEGHTGQIPFKVNKNDFSLDEWFDFLDFFKSKFPNLNQNVFLLHPEANTLNDNLLRALVAVRKRENLDS